jgi:salicylate hydroxylase
MAQLPPALRANEVSIWLGAKMHVVHYPVKQGDWMNVVAVTHEKWNSSEQLWAAPTSWSALQQALGTQSLHGDLQAILQAAPHWTRWPLNDRPPMTSPAEHALERLALAGDAAHPMRPYMAQGAAMALEDAWQMGQLLDGQTGKALDWQALLQKWAHLRWKRNAWVQAKTIRKGVLFHADGMLGALRNVALRSLPESVMDNPRLYKGP